VSGAPVVSGIPLPAFVKTAGDPAVGVTIPTVNGADFAGQPVDIALDGRPKVILFLAHWCSHCQAEVPLIQDWLNEGGAPDNVELLSVATSIDPSLPNHPPDEWLDREGWTVPVIVDPTGAAAAAYGLSAFPFWVFVGADGTVTTRMTGELPIADLETIIGALPR
jgi:thiol-disulfide isomerase/thioredoxin